LAQDLQHTGASESCEISCSGCGKDKYWNDFELDIVPRILPRIAPVRDRPAKTGAIIQPDNGELAEDSEDKRRQREQDKHRTHSSRIDPAIGSEGGNDAQWNTNQHLYHKRPEPKFGSDREAILEDIPHRASLVFEGKAKIKSEQVR